MRVSIVLLAVTALLASSNIVSAATNKDQTKLSQVTSYDAVEPLDAAQVNAPAKRSLRSHRDELEEEDSDEYPQDEDRMMKIDGMVTKANAETITGLLAYAKRVESEGGLVKGLMTPDILKYARNDREFTLFKKMYDGDVSLSTFAKMMNYNPNSNLAHNFDDVYTLYKRYIAIRNGPANHFPA
ncbi:hypothetical protein PR001_g23626 [Phytophthora rubi]|uniref:RxLR effector protein n=1 Tax=Phytophthora rubi TaxID=129364 RepID=A0A6A3IFD5_9STRA|nr:hypothetical protein PR002_g24023 [Phytophthora rubi]KAE8982780.1 hypothetical protein PR001_g23626 [Phytophthora rubi]